MIASVAEFLGMSTTGLTVWIVVLIVVGTLIVIAVSVYNRLVIRRNNYQNSFAQLRYQFI